MMNKPLFALLTALCLLAAVPSLQAQDTVQHLVPGRSNSPQQQSKPYLILISADGFRYDYASKYAAKHLQELTAKGIQAVSMLPSFPSVTFPNHYTLVTGMYPSHHGLVGNNIYDPASKSRYSLSNAKAVKNAMWYGGVPIWTLAEQQKLLSASFYWPGSEAPIGGFLPSYYYSYNEKIPLSRRIQAVVDWLSLPEAKRPHLITFYFPEVDHAGHDFGPDAPETERAVHFVDSAVQALNDAVAKTHLPVNYIFVSDHGMKAIKQDEPLALPLKADSTKMTIVSNGTNVQIFVKNKQQTDSIFGLLRGNNNDKYSAYLSRKMPAHYHYGKKDDRFNRIGDIVLIAHAPYVFSNKKPLPGAHGYDPAETPEMQATFMAWGPAFKQGITLATFENVSVYPIMAKLLGLAYRQKIDGRTRIAKKILK